MVATRAQLAKLAHLRFTLNLLTAAFQRLFFYALPTIGNRIASVSAKATASYFRPECSLLAFIFVTINQTDHAAHIFCRQACSNDSVRILMQFNVTVHHFI